MRQFLDGVQLELTAENLKKHLGKRVRYFLESDMKWYGLVVRSGIIARIYYSQVALDEAGENFIWIRDIREMVLLESKL